MWAERVRSWRSSGESATAFAEAHGFTHSSLRYWARRLAGPTKQLATPTMVRLVRQSKTPVVATQSADLVVEIGAARVRVARGFDADLLVAVARALGGGGA